VVYVAAVTIEQIIGLALAMLLMSVGVLGSLLPALPSTPIVLGTALLHRLYFGAASVSWPVLGLMVGLTLFALLLDYLASVYGAKRLGATWRGMVGAVLGALVGLFFSLPGIILGPFIGAAGFEVLGGRKSEEALRAGAGAVIGVFVGALGKTVCCVAMMTLFAFSVVGASVHLETLPT
jgi:uncharacterized protein YqgC (DUF456 family)